MLTKSLQHAYRFFFENDGYATPPGRALCAIKSARVDLLRDKLESQGRISYAWEPDDLADRGPADWGWPDKDVKHFWQTEHYVETCTLYVDSEPSESLCGIWDADNNYRRIIEKDLLAQYIPTQGTETIHLGQSCYGARQQSFSGLLT